MVGDQKVITKGIAKNNALKNRYGKPKAQKFCKLKELDSVGEVTEKKLKEHGIGLIRHLAITPISFLTDVVGLGEISARKIVKNAQKRENINFKRSSEIWDLKKNLYKLTTGSEELDDLLGGGVESGKVSEFFGENNTGKTQIAHQLCVNVQLPYEEGGLEGNALYIDSEGTYSPERIIQIAVEKGLDHNEVLQNIIVGSAYNSDHQILLVREAPTIIQEYNIKLVVVDSLISHFRSEYTEKSTTLACQNLIYGHIADMKRISNIFPNVIMFFTNQISIKPDVFFGNPIVAAGGKIVAHGSTIRVFLRKGKGEQRIAKLIQAPHLPEGEGYFIINQEGICDLEKWS